MDCLYSGWPSDKIILCVFRGKSRKKEPLGKPKRKWEDNIKINLHKIRQEGVDWIYLTQDLNQWRVLVDWLMKLGVSYV
jgi:hypothetical protein